MMLLELRYNEGNHIGSSEMRHDDMVAEAQRVTAEEFEKLATLPANTDRRLELIGGEIVELVTNQASSRLAMKIGRLIGNYLDEHNIGYLTGADGGYQIGDDRVMPDVGYISKARQPEPNHDTYNPLPPDLAVEVMSPSDTLRDMLTKVTNYLAAGTAVWVFFPDEKEVRVYAPGQPARTYTVKDTLPGGDLLSGFELPLKDLFRDE
jgi:Uma2 family endonuclease